MLDDLHRYHALVVGPGLGREPYTVAAVRATAIAATRRRSSSTATGCSPWRGTPTAPRRCSHRRTSPTVLTPHDGEFGLLAGQPPGADRFAAARRLAADLRTVVLLKGPVTVVAAPGGDVLVVANGDARLATAGTGDVLSGILGALAGRRARSVPTPRPPARGCTPRPPARARRPGSSPATSSTPSPRCSGGSS